MQIKPRYFFRKEDKLKSRKAIEELFKTGKAFSNFPLKVIRIPLNQMATLQAGVGVSSRNFKKAVDRNRIKRLIREAWRTQKFMLEEALVQKSRSMSVFFLYVGKELPTYDVIYSAVGSSVKRLIKLSNEESSSNP